MNDPSPPVLSAELRAAYQATVYEVLVQETRWCLILGERAPAQFEEWLRSQGVSAWAFVTAWNPGSRVTETAGNAAAQRALIAQVEARGWAWFPGVGRPLDPGWDAEESLLVLGLSPGDAAALGAQFGQLAVVVGSRGEACRLVGC